MLFNIRTFKIVSLAIITLLMTSAAYAQIVIDFEDDNLDDWEVVDDVDLGDAGPSTWEIRDSQSGMDGKVLYQGSNIWGNAGDNMLMGTFIIYKAEKFSNFILDVDVTAADNDGMGLVWAYESTAKHYRVIMINDGWPAPPLDGFSGPFLKADKRISDEDPWYDLLEVEAGVRYSEGTLLHWTLEVTDGSFLLTREDDASIEGADLDYKEGYLGIQLYAQQAEFDNFTIVSTAPVEPEDKMATAWGAIKDQF